MRRRIRAAELARAYQANPRQTIEDLRESLERGAAGQPGGLRPEDFSIRDLAASLIRVGDEPIGLGRLEAFCRSEAILEDALDTTAFATLTRNIVNVAILEGYTLPQFVLSRAVRTVNGRALFPRVVGVSLPLEGEVDLEVGENEAIPSVGMGDEYSRNGETKKYGAIVGLSKEAVMADETGDVLQKVSRVGELLGLKREQILTDVLCGLVEDAVTERRVGDAEEVTCDLYQDGDEQGLGDRWNNVGEVTLSDWASVGLAEQILAAITLPGTGAPVMFTRRHIVTPPQLAFTAARIVNATETRSGSGNTVVAPNPLAGLGIEVLSSPLVYSRQVAAEVEAAVAAGRWFYGDVYRALCWYQNWDVTVDESRDGEASFTHDTLVRYKATIRGVPIVTEPRAICRLDAEVEGG